MYSEVEKALIENVKQLVGVYGVGYSVNFSLKGHHYDSPVRVHSSRSVCMGWMNGYTPISELVVYCHPKIQPYANPASDLAAFERQAFNEDVIASVLRKRSNPYRRIAKYVNWLLNDEWFGRVFKTKTYAEYLRTGAVLDMNCPTCIAHPALIMLRRISEFPDQVQYWGSMVEKGVHPRVAAVLCTGLYRFGGGTNPKFVINKHPGGHFPFRLHVLTLSDLRQFKDKGWKVPKQPDLYRDGYNETSRFYESGSAPSMMLLKYLGNITGDVTEVQRGFGSEARTEIFTSIGSAAKAVVKFLEEKEFNDETPK
jgi:hypothetical protein